MMSLLALPVEGWVALACAAFLMMAAAQAVLLWKMQRALEALRPLEDRVSRLTYSLSLLVDTTQGCFDALASEVTRREEPVRATPVAAAVAPIPAPPVVAQEAVPASGGAPAPAGAPVPAKAATAARQQRQRRVVHAAKRGQSIAQIAAQEAVAEGEVALRVQMARDLQAACELT